MSAERDRLLLTGRRLEVFTVLWNSVEGVASLTLVGVSLIALGAYILVDSLRALEYHDAPSASPLGIGVAMLSRGGPRAAL